MAKSTKSKGSGNDTLDKLAKAAMSREMLAAGLAAAAAAISASPAARRKIRDAGLDAADTAQAAASTMVSSASKLGSLIAEAVADAAQRVMSGKWDDDGRFGRLATAVRQAPQSERLAREKLDREAFDRETRVNRSRKTSTTRAQNPAARLHASRPARLPQGRHAARASRLPRKSTNGRRGASRRARPADRRRHRGRRPELKVQAARSSNWSRASRAYSPPRRVSVACVPSSTIAPRSITTMRSAARTVARRCAMTIVVRSAISRSSASCTSRSLSASSADVASSSSSSGAFAQKRARDRDALSLTARQSRPAFAHERVEPFRKRTQEFLGMRIARGLPDLVLARVPIAVAEVVARGGGEHHRFLRHQRDALADVRRIGVLQVDAVDQHAPRLRIVEALGELEDGRLSGAGRPNHREPLARLHRQAEALERGHIPPRRIMEGDVLERQLAARRIGQRLRVGGRSMSGLASSSSARRSDAPAARRKSP